MTTIVAPDIMFKWSKYLRLLPHYVDEEEFLHELGTIVKQLNFIHRKLKMIQPDQIDNN